MYYRYICIFLESLVKFFDNLFFFNVGFDKNKIF